MKAPAQNQNTINNKPQNPAPTPISPNIIPDLPQPPTIPTAPASNLPPLPAAKPPPATTPGLPRLPKTNISQPPAAPKKPAKKSINFLKLLLFIGGPLLIICCALFVFYQLNLKNPVAFLLENPVSHPASLSFQPTSGTYNIGQTFTTNVIIDTGGEETNGADVIVVYDQSRLEFVSAEINDLYSDIITPNPTPNPDIPGHLALGAADSDETYNGKAIFAVITFKAIAEGTANLSFSFNPENLGSTLESNISYHGKDLLGSITGASYAIENPQNNIQCTSLYPQPDNPQRGDTLTFTCASSVTNATINHYNFRVNGGTPTRVDTDALQATYNFTVPETGNEFNVQCQVCTSADETSCTAWGQAN